MKKIISMILVLAIVLSLGITAFAGGSPVASRDPLKGKAPRLLVDCFRIYGPDGNIRRLVSYDNVIIKDNDMTEVAGLSESVIYWFNITLVDDTLAEDEYLEMILYNVVPIRVYGNNMKEMPVERIQDYYWDVHITELGNVLVVKDGREV